MSLIKRGIQCLRENGLKYTINNIKRKVVRWLQKKIIMVNYYDDLRNRVNNYQNRYPITPRRTAARLIWWNFKSFFKKHKAIGKNNPERPSPKKEVHPAPKPNAKEFPLQLSPDVLNIGFLLNGGMGDFLLEANYIFKFREKYGYDRIRIDVFARNSYPVAQSIFYSGDVIDNIYPWQGFEEQYKNYDLFVHISRYPDIKRRQLNRLAELEPELLDYVFMCEKFRAKNDRFFSKAGITDGQSAILSILDGKKRIQQPDVYGFLGITEKYEFPLKIYEDEIAYLKSLDLLNRPFITLHRGCDTRYSSNSVKLWPLQYYNILIRMIKKAYPDLLIIQIGVSHDRCLDMTGTDLNLVEKTTLDQVKVLLKHSLLHIDAEGGMVHLRHALCGKKSIVVFGPTSVDFFGYSENVNMVGNGCDTWCEWAVQGWMESCLRGRDPADPAPCMASVIPEAVFDEVRTFLDSTGGDYL